MMQMMKKAFFGALFSCFYLYISEKSSKFASDFGKTDKIVHKYVGKTDKILLDRKLVSFPSEII